jgi:acetylornithine deacetylase/succinyl-diaminopimelate desuccinylase family protein
MLDLIETLRQLVAIPSVNAMGQSGLAGEVGEARVTDYLERLFSRLGLPAVRQPVEPGRDNIFARVDGGDGPGDRPLILFEAHQDTVPVTGMTIPPWEPTVRDGRLYGRGSCDTKGGMAAMLFALARLHQERPNRMPGVVMACTVNEEFGFSGAKAAAEFWREGATGILPRSPDLAVVAEPTELQVVVAHKGLVRWRCRALGRAAHSAAPQAGVNAIYRMARALVAVERYANEIVGTLGSHPLCGRPTLNVGTIAGGLSVNTVPDRVTIEIDRRMVPSENPDAARQHVIDYLDREAGLGFALEHEPPFMEALPLSDEPNRALAQRLLEAASTVVRPCALVGVPYGTDAAFYTSTGVPSVVFGPGSIAQAHTADEWVELDQVQEAAEVYYRFVKAFC